MNYPVNFANNISKRGAASSQASYPSPKLRDVVGREEVNENFKPEVIVRIKNLDNEVEIRVKDNGPGIPEDINDKIFQPFFTTKPTGSGTGLGLSLSYDIVKAHGGELTVETKEGEGSDFIIKLSTVT